MATTIIDVEPFEFEKQPAEKETIGINFSRRVPAGATVTSYTVVSELYDNSPEKVSASTDPLQVSNISLSTNKTLSCLISNGQDGYKYKVTFTLNLSDLQAKQDEIFVTVKEK
jgi:hypothetical protein